MRETIKNLLLVPNDELGLATGAAGLGLVLLKAKQTLDEDWVAGRLSSCIEFCLSRQLQDGSWPLHAGRDKSHILLSQSNGVSGVLIFLTQALRVYNRPDLETAVRNGFGWLLKQSVLIKGQRRWPSVSKTRDINLVSLSDGMPGIGLAFLCGYEVLGDRSYAASLFDISSCLTKQTVLMDYSFAHGLAGLGCFYIEVFRVMGGEEWYERANWIANVFLNSYIVDKAAIYWNIDHTTTSTAGLYQGNGGILYFLSQLTNPKEPSIF